VKFCSHCGIENLDQAQACTTCGAAFPQGDATGGIIPYKNPNALLAYYLGILSGLPFIGLPLGIASFILGIRGLQARKNNPIVKGSVHAGIGIGCGCFFSILWTFVIVSIVIGITTKK
jgi:hypothetical protein